MVDTKKLLVDASGHEFLKLGWIVKVIAITPELAKLFYQANVGNRKVKPNQVRRLATTMGYGDWRLNGEPIIFDSLGRLCNGQHRILAIIESNRTIDVLVVWGVEPKAFETMDLGVPRKLNDALKQEGFSDSMQLSSAVGNLHRWLTNRMGATAQVSPDPKLGVRLAQQHPGLGESIIIVTPCAKEHYLPHGAAACFHYLFSYLDKEAATEFFRALTDGVALSATDAVYVLRESLGAERDLSRSKSKRSARRMPPVVRLAKTVKAWNLSRQVGVECKRLTWSPAKGEPFPEIDGLTREMVDRAPRASDFPVEVPELAIV